MRVLAGQRIRMRICGGIRDRIHHFSVAAGSAKEVRTILRVAVAWGELTH